MTVDERAALVSDLRTAHSYVVFGRLAAAAALIQADGKRIAEYESIVRCHDRCGSDNCAHWDDLRYLASKERAR